MIPTIPREKKSFAHRHFPVTDWLPGYQRSWLAGDLLAGLTIWALLVPEAIAYAEVAGVPGQYGLYAAPLALLAYFVLGGSKRLVVGPASTLAILSASVVAPVAASGGEPDRYVALTITLAIMVGVLLVAAGLMRLGFVARFLAGPVLYGFITGLAVTIAIGQAGKLFGVQASGDTALQKTVSLVSKVGDWYWLPLVVGAGCIAAMLATDRFLPRVPGALVVVVGTILLAWALDLGQHGVHLVGKTPSGLSPWMLKGIGLEDVYHLLPGALSVALVAFTESIAVANDDAVRHGYRIDGNQEMIAVGMSNIGAGILQGIPVNGSLSRSSASEDAGGKSQVTGLVCGVLALATVLFLTGLLEYLPEATLAAIVIHALKRYFRVDGLVRLWKVRKQDFWLSLSAFAGVVLFGVLPGVALGVVLSLALLILRASSPNSAVLGREPGGTRFADVTNNPDYETVPGLLVYRFDAPLVFPNADRFASELRDLVATATPPVRCVVIDFEAIYDVDTTASDRFTELVKEFQRDGVRLMLARVHAPVCEFLRRDGIVELIGDESFYHRVLDAVAAFENDPEAS